MTTSAVKLSRYDRYDAANTFIHAIEQAKFEAGRMLKLIRDDELYKEAGYPDFKTYCRQQLGITLAEANRRIGRFEIWRVVAQVQEEQTSASIKASTDLSALV